MLLALLIVGCEDEGTKSHFIGEWNLIDMSCKENPEPLCSCDNLDDIEILTFNDNHTYEWDTYSKVVKDSITVSEIGTWYTTNYDNVVSYDLGKSPVDVMDSLFLTHDTTVSSYGYTFTESLDDTYSHYILKIYWKSCYIDTYIPNP